MKVFPSKFRKHSANELSGFDLAHFFFAATGVVILKAAAHALLLQGFVQQKSSNMQIKNRTVSSSVDLWLFRAKNIREPVATRDEGSRLSHGPKARF